MGRRKYSGRFFMLAGALVLLLWAGYEFYVRMEMLVWFLKGMIRSVVEENRNFFHEIRYYDPKMFWLTGFLLACALFALLAILLRNRPKAGYVLIALDLALIYAGGAKLGLFGLGSADWLQTLKLLPLLLILAGNVVNLISYSLRRRRQTQQDRLPAPSRYASERKMARLVEMRRRDRRRA
ncbi:MAG: hypothetical protein GX246_03855 [Clostridiales bacterium]|nr:hypothetical protein [Bacillota bacterium]NLL54266.1 hypothetical protein [Clostridiales bacterium]